MRMDLERERENIENNLDFVYLTPITNSPLKFDRYRAHRPCTMRLHVLEIAEHDPLTS